MNDTEALLAMVAWGNKQPDARGWVVLALPEGRLTLETPLKVTRSKTVLRGAGSAATEIYVPKSLMQLFGARRGALLLRCRSRRHAAACQACWRMPAAQVAGLLPLFCCCCCC